MPPNISRSSGGLTMRTSRVDAYTDTAGNYEVELFDHPNPKGVIVCAHGVGVRRWDGHRFFYEIAEHYTNHTVMLVDQNQPLPDGGCELPDLGIMVARVQQLITIARQTYPDALITVVAHSHGCGVATRLATEDVARIVFVTPTAGDATAKLVRRYGPDITAGKQVTSSDGLSKYYTADYVRSVQDVVWEEEYRKLLARYPEVYAFEAEQEEVVGPERFAHRDMPFARYTILPDATHNLHGDALRRFLFDLDQLV